MTDEAPPFHPGSPEEQYLRNHLSYLAPTDRARIQLALRMLAGLMVNVLFVGLPLFILGLLVGLGAREAYGGMEINRTTCPRGPATCEFDAVVPTAVWMGIAGVGALAAGLAVTGVMWRTRRDIWRVALETWQVRLLLLAGAGLVLLVAVPWLAEQALDRGDLQQPSSGDAGLSSAAVSAVSSLAALFAAAIGYLRGVVRDDRQAAAGVSRVLGRFATRFRNFLVATVVMLGGPLLLAAICVLGTLVAVTTLPADADTLDLGPLGEVTPAFLAWLGGSRPCSRRCGRRSTSPRSPSIPSTGGGCARRSHSAGCG